MSIAGKYKNQCDHCQRTNPEYFIQVNYNKNGIESEFWCLDCLINKGKWKVKINSIQSKHFILFLYFTNLLSGYSDSKSVINKNKIWYDHIYLSRGIIRDFYTFILFLKIKLL